MGNGDPVGRAELRAELRSVRYEMRLLMSGIVIVHVINLPDGVTVPAITALAAKALWGLATARFYG